MNKGLEALEQLYLHFNPNLTSEDKSLEYKNTIEKALKALEIIKNKQVNMFIFLDIPSVKSAKDYNIYVDDTITQEEYDILKEVLL